MRKIALFLSIVIACSFVLVACNNNSMPATENVIEASDVIKVGEGEKEFELTVITDDGKENVFEISTDKDTVGAALVECNLIDGEDGPFGMYVKTVNSITYDFDKDGKYWAFYINGQYATSGVDKTFIEEAETYMFKGE